MHRNDHATATTEDLFTEGDPQQGTPATVVTAAFLNAVQEELCNLVEEAGLTLDEADHTQVFDAIKTLMTPVGDLSCRPVSTAPAGWLECDGSAVAKTTYPALYTVLKDGGSTCIYGETSTTFNLPDYRGEFLRGWDHGAGVDPDAATRTNRGDGTTGDNVGTKQEDLLESHSHTYTPVVHENRENGSHTSAQAGDPTATSSTGGNETRPKNINVLWCIKY